MYQKQTDFTVFITIFDTMHGLTLLTLLSRDSGAALHRGLVDYRQLVSLLCAIL
jgi:hypothetical protein